MAVALQWASRVMAISIAMVLPGLLGLWADSRLGTKVLFTVVGFGFGVVSGVWQLVRITAPREFDRRDDKTNQDKTNQDKTNQDKTNQDKTNQDKTNQDKTNQDKTNQDKTNQDKTNQDGANQDGGGPARDKTDP